VKLKRGNGSHPVAEMLLPRIVSITSDIR